MKILLVACGFALAGLSGLTAEAAHAPAHGPSAEGAASPLTEEERALTFRPSVLAVDEAGLGQVWVHGEPLSQARLAALSPWDLMDLVQTLTGQDLPLGRFGRGAGDPLTQAWQNRLVAFARQADSPHAHQADDLFDPGLVLWDPGYIQFQNEWGQWSIHLAQRDITQGDLPSLSPLEVQQAVEVLTGRTYSVEFVLAHLEAFRAQLSIVPR